MNLYLPMHENGFYHIYNRGNNGDNLFYTNENYFYFLNKYDQYLSDYLETYAYCLLPNHFHILVRVKEGITPLVSDVKTYEGTDKVVSEAFRRFFTSYAKSINKQEERTGSLFQKNFKRKEVNNKAYFTQLVYYIHSNPAQHNICADFREYPYSSYGRILIEKPSKLFKDEVINWFGSKEEYINFHSQEHHLRKINSLMIEN